MQLFARLPDAFDQARLDVHVNVFKRYRPGKITTFDIREDLCQTANNFIAFRPGNNFDVREHAGMRYRTLDVIAIKPLVKVDRGSKGFNEGIGRFSKPPAPGFC
jgi:hypothetical protein